MTQLNFHAAMTPAPRSISSSSMLVDLGISVWTARRLDRTASAAVTSQAGARRGVANVNKKLLGDCAELEAVQKFASTVRTSHYSSTMPWSDTGMRLLPTSMFFKYNEQMTGLKAEFDRLVERFLDAYDWEVTQAQAKLGDLFNLDEYPTRAKVSERFGFRLSYVPLPDSGDWRVDIERDAQDALRSQYETFYEEQTKRAMGDVWTRLHDEASRFIRQLSVDTDGKKGKVFESTLEHVQHLTEMLEATNFNNDPNLTLAHNRLRSALNGVTRGQLVKDDDVRAVTKRALEDAMASLPGLGM